MTQRSASRPRWRRLRENASRARRGVIVLPSAFTLGNLFFGLYAVVSAWRGSFEWAAWCIVISATLDYLDGRIARVTRTGTAFGTELDSLVDAISFGVAPALVLTALYLGDSDWGWLVGFAYVSATVVRLARYNVDQAGAAPHHFQGLPTPAAGVILTAHYPFTQTALVQELLAPLPWARIMVIVTILVALLMVSNVPYAKMPPPDLSSRRGIVRTSLLAGSVVVALSVPRYWFFPAMAGYALWGLLRFVLLGRPRARRRPGQARRQRQQGPSGHDAEEELGPTDINHWKENRS